MTPGEKLRLRTCPVLYRSPPRSFKSTWQAPFFIWKSNIVWLQADQLLYPTGCGVLLLGRMRHIGLYSRGSLLLFTKAQRWEQQHLPPSCVSIETTAGEASITLKCGEDELPFWLIFFLSQLKMKIFCERRSPVTFFLPSLWKLFENCNMWARCWSHLCVIQTIRESLL